MVVLDPSQHRRACHWASDTHEAENPCVVWAVRLPGGGVDDPHDLIGGDDEMNLVELILARCAQQPESIALQRPTGTTRYGELAQLVEARAALLSRRTKPGDVVGVTGASLDVLTSYLAALLVGRTASLGDSATLTDSTVIIDGDEVVRPDKATGKPLEVPGGSVILFTSGTSGQPKRVLHGISSLSSGLLNTVSVEAELTDAGLPDSSDDLSSLLQWRPHGLGLLSGMALRSVAGLSMLNRSLAMGETLVLPMDLTPASLWKELSSDLVTTAGLPPIAAQQLLRRARSEGWGKPGLFSIGLGGASVGTELAHDLEETFACPVTSGYGSTELGGVALMSRPWDPPDQRWSTVGRPIGSVRVRFDETDAGSRELLVQSPAAMLGTLSTGNQLIDAPEWIRTGDSAFLRPDGAIEISSRLDFVIQRGGRRIDPASIEEVLRTHSAVVAVGVVGLPSRVAGEEDIWALVQLSDDGVHPELVSLCRERLEPHEVPRRIIAVERVPRTSDGTPQRADLPRLAAQHRDDDH
jgi:acyl-coenzyme A synthetase/AMP-(fatty) acid ligase